MASRRATSPTVAPVQLMTLNDAEWKHIDDVLTAVLGNRTRAAMLLGIDRSTLVRKLRRRDEQQGSQG